ncbi:hypothetical protein CesoFtcFv8_003783 [Champsocephalus esox]|uniref:Uncharacterized protein n=1 Tax=Champsocephalus esox TaxID=159716 RepID=A0AAN8CVM0_9TELE|nr:hypothetical protein CesoFtcFv8_003783 [Champsocephalus esox]
MVLHPFSLRHKPNGTALLAPPRPSPPQRPVSLLWLSEVDALLKASSLLLHSGCVYRPYHGPVDTSTTHRSP